MKLQKQEMKKAFETHIYGKRNFMKKYFLLVLLFLMANRLFAIPVIFDSYVTFIVSLKDASLNQCFADESISDKKFDSKRIGKYTVLIDMTYYPCEYRIKTDKEKIKKNFVKAPCYVKLYTESQEKNELKLLRVKIKSSEGTTVFEKKSNFPNFSTSMVNARLLCSSIDLEFVEFPVGKENSFSVEAVIMIDGKVSSVNYDFTVKRKKSFLRLLD